MKKTASALLLFILLCSACIPAFAQKTRSVGVPPIQEAAHVQFERIDALSEGKGVLIRWATSAEIQNVGFYVYRSGDNGLELVNDLLVASSDLGTRPTAFHGDKYELYDPQGTLNSTYVIQNMFLDGRRSSTDTIGVTYTNDLEAASGRSRDALESSLKTKNGIIEKGALSLPKELQRTVESAQPESDINEHRRVVSLPGAKIGIKNNGFYRVSRASLPATVFDGTDSANWRLFLEGVEQGIIIGSGDQYIEFYGKGIDTVESDTRMYYLINDTVPGPRKRIPTKVLRPVGGNTVSNNYQASTEKKERLFYNSTIKNGPLENYWGRVITNLPPAPGAEIQANLTGIDFSSPNIAVTLRLQGIQGSDHNIKVVLNGVEVGAILGTGSTNFAQTITVPTSRFVEGINLFALAEVNSARVCYFDTISTSYTRKYQAEANKVSFYTPGYRKVDVTGFTSPSVRVFDLTSDSNPFQAINFPIEQNGATFTAKLPSHRAMVMYGVEDSAIMAPASVTANTGSTLSIPANNADLVIISHSDPLFMTAAQNWGNYRSSVAGGSFVVKVIDVADIFDEFNFGVPSAISIHDFLEYAKGNWNTKPNYALLLGDASYDPRNYQGFGSWNLIPSQMVTLIFEECASDEALGDLNHDGVSDIGIGRISGRTSFEITAAFNKTSNFETQGVQTPDRGVLFASDLPAPPYDFLGMSTEIAGQLPMNVTKNYVNRGLPPPNPNNDADPQAHANLMTALNGGKFLVNYSGHGSAGIWGASSFFQTSDVSQLTNTNNLSIFTMLTCYNGLFFRPESNSDSVAERLLKFQNGGAVASWASTTETIPGYQVLMAKRFYNQVGVGTIKRMGDLVKDAKLTIAGSDVGYSWVLLGDPTLRVRQ